MERFPTELVYLLAFLGYIVYSYFTQQAARRRQQEEQAQAEAAGQHEPPPAEDEPLEHIWGRAPEPAPAPPSVLATRPALPAGPTPRAAPASPQVARRLHPVRALLKDKRDLRRAVILTMVLGPCRAQEPPEQR